MNRSLIGLFLFIVALVISLSVLVPKIRQVREITLDKKAKETVLATKKARLAAFTQLKTTFASQQAKIAAITATLPQEPQIPDILVSLESMGKESGVKLVSLVPQVTKRDKAVYVTIVGSGDMTAIEQFAQLVADNNRPISLQTVSLAKGQDTHTISFTATLLVPYIPSQAPGSGG